MRTATLLLALLLFPLSAFAQNVVMRSAGDGPAPVMVVPGGMLMLEEAESVSVRRFLKLDEDEESVNIEEGDLIIFLNGTRIESLAQLVGLYEETEEGDEIKLGIQRGEAKMIRTYDRPEMRNVNVSSDGGGMRIAITGEGPGMEPGLLRELDNPGFWPAGFMVGEKDNEVLIGNSIPIPNKAESLQALEAGDVVVSINGVAVSTVEALNKAYEGIAVGDEVTMKYKKDGNTHTATFAKPQPPQMQMRIERN